MKKLGSSIGIISILIAVAVESEVKLGRIERTDPLGRELLYLPSPEFLKLASFGNTGLVADFLYLWSIQYYSQFRPQERFLYLETVYNLITDLDPLYSDAYRIGTLIMGIQTGRDPDELQQAVQRLFDKGIHNMPDNWVLAETAAWDMFIRFHDRKAALHYAEIASKQPGVPARIKRMVGVWRDAERDWTVDDSVAYWQQAVQDAEDEYDRKMSLSKLYDAVVAKDRQRIDHLLHAYATRFGRCTTSWDDVISAGLLDQVPLDLVGNPYEIDRENCTIVALKNIKDQ